MSKRHTLKCWPESFQSTWDGTKKHETRKNDRDYQVGDSLCLMEWDPKTEKYLGRLMGATVTYVSRGPDWGIPEGLCVMSVEVWERKPLPLLVPSVTYEAGDRDARQEKPE